MFILLLNSRFHEFLKQENEVGNITRQEAVSMVGISFMLCVCSVFGGGWVRCGCVCTCMHAFMHFFSYMILPVIIISFLALNIFDWLLCMTYFLFLHFDCRYLPCSWMCYLITMYLTVSFLFFWIFCWRNPFCY